MSDGEDYDGEDYYEGGEDDYYDDGGQMEEEHHEDVELPAQLIKKQSSVATHKNVEFVLKNEIINRIEKSIEAVQNEQGISSGRALFLLKACKYNIQDTQNIPHKIMDDIYFSETKEAIENKNKSNCLECQKELNQNSFHLECNHCYCIECAENYITEQFKKQEDENRVCCKCPFPSCKERFGDKDFKKLLGEQQFKDYCKFLEDDALKIADYIIRCPSSDCLYVIVQLDQISLKSYAKSMRCQCRTLFCSSCGSNAHEPLKCSIVKTLNQLEQSYSQIKMLQDKESLYRNQETRSSSNYSSSFSSDFCPNGCFKFLVPKQDNPKLRQCPFCEGVFCADCKQLYPCKCVKQEETKEDQMEEDNYQKDKNNKQGKQVELPVVVNYFMNLLGMFTKSKDELLFIKVAKRKISEYLQNAFKFVTDKGKYESELNFVHSSLDSLEDLLLFISHSNLFITIGATSKSDLLKFQLEDLQSQFSQLKKELLTDDYNYFYKQLKPDQVFSQQFQNLKESVGVIVNKITRNQSSCQNDFIGVNLNDETFENYFNLYQKLSPQAIITVKKEQEKIDNEKKAQNSRFGMMGFGDFGGDMRGGRMHGYGGGPHEHSRYGGHQSRGMPKKYHQDSDDENDYQQRRQGGYQNKYNYMDDSDDDNDNHFVPSMKNPQQLLEEFLFFVEYKHKEHYQEVKKEKTVEDARKKLSELIEKNKPIYKSENILVILPQGLKINDNIYLMNLEQDKIENNKVLLEIINQYEQIFKAYDNKQKNIHQVTPWKASFFDYFEFLIMDEYIKFKPDQIPKVDKTCIACKQPLYPQADEQLATKILTSSQNITDTDVIQLKGCNHPIHIGCYKPLVTPQVTYKCPCSMEYYKPLANDIKAKMVQNADYQSVEINYTILKLTINNEVMNGIVVKAYLYPYDENITEDTFNCYRQAFFRGLTFELTEDGKLQFRINHLTDAPPKYKQLARNTREFMYELNKQFESYNIKPK